MMIKDAVEAIRYCDRCHCSVPLSEWRVTLAARGVRHVGPMRDHKSDRFVEPDEDGQTRCGFFEPFPWAKAIDPEAR